MVYHLPVGEGKGNHRVKYPDPRGVIRVIFPGVWILIKYKKPMGTLWGSRGLSYEIFPDPRVYHCLSKIKSDIPPPLADWVVGQHQFESHIIHLQILSWWINDQTNPCKKKRILGNNIENNLQSSFTFVCTLGSSLSVIFCLSQRTRIKNSYIIVGRHFNTLL